MLEQNLSTLFRGFATEIESHRSAIISLGPEANEAIAALDDLVVFLTQQAQILDEHIA